MLTHERVMALFFCCIFLPVCLEAQSASVCLKKDSNAETYTCFMRAAERASAEVERLTNKVVEDFRAAAVDIRKEGSVEANAQEEAAALVLSSHKSWLEYRESHCRAVAKSYGAGSGAGIGYEACLLRVDKARLEELRNAFVKPQI